MTKVRAARKAYVQAQRDSKTVLAHARVKLGQAIKEARQAEEPQERIADELELTRERLRLFEREHDQALKDGTFTSPLELQLAARIVLQLTEGDPDRLTELYRAISDLAQADVHAEA